MATYVTIIGGLVTNRVTVSSKGDLPELASRDKWVDVSAINPAPKVGDTYNGSSFVGGSAVGAAQGSKVAELRNVCADEIRAGFTNSVFFDNSPNPQALTYLYPANDTDQANMTSILAAALVEAQRPGRDPSASFRAIWCVRCSPAGVPLPGAAWELKDHTVDQCLIVGKNSGIHIQDRQFVLAELDAATRAAPNIGAVNAIVWTPQPL